VPPRHGKNFKVNSDILALYMKGVNPHDEIKGSISTPEVAVDEKHHQLPY
jgi:hypothetical protein